MKHETSAEPVMGPSEGKMPTTICIKHSDLPGLDTAALGDRIKVIVTGKIISNRAEDKYADGDAQIEVTNIENVDPVKKENAATMHLDKLKSKISKKEETDDEAEDKAAGIEEKEVESEESDKGE